MGKISWLGALLGAFCLFGGVVGSLPFLDLDFGLDKSASASGAVSGGLGNAGFDASGAIGGSKSIGIDKGIGPDFIPLDNHDQFGHPPPQIGHPRPGVPCDQPHQHFQRGPIKRGAGEGHDGGHQSMSSSHEGHGGMHTRGVNDQMSMSSSHEGHGSMSQMGHEGSSMHTRGVNDHQMSMSSSHGGMSQMNQGHSGMHKREVGDDAQDLEDKQNEQRDLMTSGAYQASSNNMAGQSHSMHTRGAEGMNTHQMSMSSPQSMSPSHDGHGGMHTRGVNDQMSMSSPHSMSSSHGGMQGGSSMHTRGVNDHQMSMSSPHSMSSSHGDMSQMNQGHAGMHKREVGDDAQDLEDKQNEQRDLMTSGGYQAGSNNMQGHSMHTRGAGEGHSQGGHEGSHGGMHTRGVNDQMAMSSSHEGHGSMSQMGHGGMQGGSSMHTRGVNDHQMSMSSPHSMSSSHQGMEGGSSMHTRGVNDHQMSMSSHSGMSQMGHGGMGNVLRAVYEAAPLPQGYSPDNHAYQPSSSYGPSSYQPHGAYQQPSSSYGHQQHRRDLNPYDPADPSNDHDELRRSDDDDDDDDDDKKDSTRKASNSTTDAKAPANGTARVARSELGHAIALQNSSKNATEGAKVKRNQNERPISPRMSGMARVFNSVFGH